MDVRNINQVFVAKNCGRTSPAGTEVIDGLTVPIGAVQIHAKLVDAGTAALSYYGNGELLITDESGRALTTTTAVKAVPEITIHQRSYTGSNHFASKAINGANITSYTLTPYEAPAEKVAIIHTIDATHTSWPYMIKVRRIGSDNNKIKEPSVKTAYFKSASAGSTGAEIATGLVAYINDNFNTDPLMPFSAAVTGAASNEITITALPLKFEVGKFNYAKLDFVVELVNFDATVLYNDSADLVHNAVTHLQFTKGAGTYMQVAEMENFAKLYTGANKDKVNPGYRRVEVALDAQQYEDDGVTENRYDTVVINWTRATGDFSMNVRQEGTVTLCLPADDNATNQVGVALTGIMAVLDKYIVTEYGIGAVQIGNIT